MKIVFICAILLNIHVLLSFKNPKIKEVLIISLHHVSDGDTITVLAQNGTKLRIRMAFIDAPEINQPFGEEAKIRLISILKNSTFFKVYQYSEDSYNRILGMISTLDGTDVNKLMVKEGLAWCFYKRCPKEYKELLNIAKSKKLGLWKIENPLAPWKYRKSEMKRHKVLKKHHKDKQNHKKDELL